jgi:hypothetical protein
VAQQSPTYAEEYALYQQAASETSAAKQKDLVLQFVGKYKKSELDSHVAYLYAQYLNGMKQNSQWTQLAAAAEEYLRYRPTDSTAAAMATEAYQKLGQPAKLVEFGSRLYSQAPSGATAYLVTTAYYGMGDYPNTDKWAERTLKHDPKNIDVIKLLIFTDWQSNNFAKAAGHGEQLLAAMGEKEDPATNPTRAFANRAIGENAHRLGDSSTAYRYFKEAVRLEPKDDFGQFRLAECCWRNGRIDDAILSYARAVALNGDSAREARQQLYNLLRTRYGNTSNATKFIDAAKKELGVS